MKQNVSAVFLEHSYARVKDFSNEENLYFEADDTENTPTGNKV